MVDVGSIIFVITGAATFFTLGHVYGRSYELKRELKRQNEAMAEAQIRKYTVDID